MSGAAAYSQRQVLIACRDLETAMAGLYDTLARIHEDVPAVAKLWSKTANDERNHALQFGLVLEIGNEAVAAVREDLSHIERTRRSIELRAQEFMSRPPTVDQALRIAIALEEELSDLHADHVPIFTTDRFRKLFSAMMAADREHVGRLRKALASYAARAAVPVVSPREK